MNVITIQRCLSINVIDKKKSYVTKMKALTVADTKHQAVEIPGIIPSLRKQSDLLPTSQSQWLWLSVISYINKKSTCQNNNIM